MALGAGIDSSKQSCKVVVRDADGAGGLVLVPYLKGERTPDRPDATGAVHGLQLATATPAHLARAAVEGLLCGLADGLDALVAQGARIDRVLLVGGGARSEAVCRLAPAVLGRTVVVPPAGEYVADGAARQAAWVLSGKPSPPAWGDGGGRRFDAEPLPDVRAALRRGPGAHRLARRQALRAPPQATRRHMTACRVAVQQLHYGQ